MRKFLNFTELSDDEARNTIEEKRDLVLRGEADREVRAENDEENINFWLNNIWTDKELTNFFEAFDLTPYSVPVQRPLINNLISKQRNRKISFDFVPTDIHSYQRFRSGREEFMARQMADPDSGFLTSEEAGKYYDKYADDHYANAVTAYLHNLRIENKAKHIESEVFQQGLISGLDFFKAIYSRKNNRTGGLEITRRPQRAVFYDETSTEYDLSDIEFIGEVHRLYKNQLKIQYPDYSEEIEEFFKEFTNKDKPASTKNQIRWKDFYDLNYSGREQARLRVAEIWCLENEERFVVTDNEEGTSRVVEYGMEEDQIVDDLMSLILIEKQEQAQTDPEVAELLQSPTIKNEIASEVQERFNITITVEPIWYKSVFSYNCLFEHKRSPLPHESHPYFPFFAQFTEGEFTSMMDDIKDIIIAINKALAFRELMMSHGAKGMVIVDEKVFAQSGYSIDDVADHYASVGGIMAVKLKPGQSVGDILASVTTVGDGLDAINYLLSDLDNRLFHISGVTMEQLGVVQRETTASGLRQQLAAGEANNGLIYDNFYRSMEGFYSDKVVPLLTHLMATQPNQVIRRIGDEHQPWIELDLEEDFDLFDSEVRSGNYNMVLRPITDSAQIQEERASKYLELAMAGLMDVEVALEFSTDPDRFKILRRMKEKEQERAKRQAMSQFSMEEFYQIAAQSGLPMDAIEELIDQMKREKLQQMKEGGDGATGEQIQRRQGAQGQQSQVIQDQASESQRLEQIDRQTQTEAPQG